MSMIKVETDAQRELPRKLQKVSRSVANGVVRGVNRESAALHAYVVKTHLTGAGDNPAANRAAQKLRRRTGDFIRKTKSRKALKVGERVFGGMDFESKVAATHVGEKGKVTIIRPKQAKWLTIPLPAAMTNAGVTRRGATEQVNFSSEGFGGQERMSFKQRDKDLFFLWKKGSPSPVLAKKVGKRGKIVPFFVLKKEVRIKTRIHPKEIIRTNRNKIIAGIRRAVMESVQREDLS